jgi:uncharacterized membrane protein
MPRRLPDYAKPLAILIGVYVLFFFWLAYRRWAVFGNDTSDFGYFDNMFWHTIHGRPFYCSAQGGSNLAVHAAFLWSLLVPVYWVFPGVPTLLFLQSLFLGLCGVPVYLIARRIFDDHRTALFSAAAFLMLPPIVSQHVNQIEEPSFIGVFLLFAYWFYKQEKFGWFLLLAGVACLGRENVPLAIGMFGIYAAVQRRRWKWIIAPVLLGGAYFYLAVFVIMPYFRQGLHWHVLKMFSYLGDTPGQIVTNIITQPGMVIDHLLGEQNLQYFVFLVQPMGWVLPFGSLAFLMALPDIGINLLSDNSALKVIPWHYNVFTACFLFIATMYTVGKLGGRLRQRYGAARFELVAVSALLLLAVGHWFLWLQWQQYIKRPYHDSMMRAIHAVPPDAPVIVPVRFQGHIGGRARYDHLNYFNTKPEYAKQYDYVILDGNERQYPPFVTQEFFDSFYKNPQYQLVFAENGVFVFHRLGPASDWSVHPTS